MDPKNPTQPTHEEEIAFRDAERAMGRDAMRVLELVDELTELNADDHFGLEL